MPVDCAWLCMAEASEVQMVCSSFARGSTALVLIDVQQSFTTGSWAQSVGIEQVAPIAGAFQRCKDVVERIGGKGNSFPLLATRCPFFGSSFLPPPEMQTLLPRFLIKVSPEVVF